MLEETPDEFHDVKSYCPVSYTSVLSIFKGDGAIDDFDDPVVGDGHFEDIWGKVFQRGVAISNGLTVDDPVGFPYFGVDLIQKTGFIHLLFELCAEDWRERLDGDIEVGS